MHALRRLRGRLPDGARQMIGREMTVAEVVDAVLKDRIFYEESGGGVTISGGEPLLQPRFVTALALAIRATGVHLALDTTGFGCTNICSRRPAFPIWCCMT